MRYHFGAYSLDTQLYELRHAGEALHLGPQVFNVLAYLLAHRDRVVSRDELFTELWPDQFVTDDALGRCIQTLRRVLGDNPKTSAYIATVRGRGYRFIASTHELPDAPPADAASVIEPDPRETRAPTIAFEATPQTLGPPISETSHPIPDISGSPSFDLSGEYKQVTVCSGGVAAASDLARRLGPERMHDVMQMLYAVLQHILRQYAGGLIEFSGDSFLVLFGAPEAQEDHAQRAVLSALALLERLREAYVSRGLAPDESPELRLALHSGRVVVDWLGDEPQRLYTAAGKTTQLAIHLRQRAKPGVVFISDATCQLVHEEVWSEPQREIEMDAGQPTQAYRVLGVRRMRSGVAGDGRRALTPFVGRDRELAMLHERFDLAVAGQGQVVGLVGEAGMGKSRLLAEFRRGLFDRPVMFAEGLCLAYGSDTPFLPVLDLVRQFCDITADDNYNAIIGKVQEHLDKEMITEADAVPLLLQLLSIPVDAQSLPTLNPAARQERTFDLLRRLLLYQAQRQPCLIVIENLHWSDATSAEWLTSLVERLAGFSVMLLATYRPGYQPPWMAQSYATQIALPQLRKDDSRSLILSLRPSASLSEALVQAILSKAEGNPFFLEELVLHAAEQGIQHPPLRAPETLQAVLAARIDRLPTDAKRVLQTAAVIEMHMTFSLLQAATNLSEDDLRLRLDHLRTAEFLYETGKLSAGVYAFKHALVQEVAYQSLLKRTRQRLHQRVAERLEQQFPDTVATQPELAAHHYTEAGCIEPAIGYWRQAGARATQRAAYAEAITHLSKGLALLRNQVDTPTRDQQELDMQMILGPALIAAKGLASPDVERTYTRARLLCQRVGETADLVPVLVGLSRYYLSCGAVQIAQELGEQLLSAAAHQRDDALLQTARAGLGSILCYVGDFVGAHELATQDNDVVDPIRQHALALRYGRAPRLLTLTNDAQALWYLGYPDQALQRSQRAHALARDMSHPPSLAVTLYWEARVRQLRREASAVHERAETLVTLATTHSLTLYAAWGIFLRGWALAAQGESEAGVEQMRVGLANSVATGNERSRPLFLSLLAEAYGKLGQTDTGLRLLAKAQEMLETSGRNDIKAEWRRIKGELLLQQDKSDFQQAERCFCEALDVARAQRAKSIELRAATSLAQLWRRQGKRQEARGLLAPIYGGFTEGHDTADLREAQALLS